MRTSLRMGALGLLISALAATAQDDWLQFRGPGGQGLADRGPVAWDPEKDLAWKIPIDAKGWSSPLISDGKVVLTGATGSGDDTRLHVLAFDTGSGALLWSRELFTPTRDERLAKHSKNSLATATPIIRDGIIYAHFGHMGTAALALEDGGILWKTKYSYPPKHGAGSSPILAGNHLVFSADGDKDPALVALHTATGDIVWKTPRNNRARQSFSFATPILVEQQGNPVIVSPTSGMVGGYDPSDGKLLWKTTFKEGFSLTARPVEMDGIVYLSTGHIRPTTLAISLTPPAKGDITSTHLLWSEKKFGTETPSFIATDGVLYILDDTGMLTCRDGRSGGLRWKEKLVGNFSASPVLAGDILHCQTEEGVCYVVKVSADGAELIHEVDLEQSILASPAVVDGALYLRTGTHLWKISAKEPQAGE